MASFPSFYVSDLERKRQRSEEMSKGMQDASATALQGLDAFSRLQRQLAEDAFKKEQAGKVNARADEALGIDKERLGLAKAEAQERGIDRARELTEKAAEAEEKRKAAEREAEAAQRRGSLEALPRFVQSGIERGQGVQDIARAAHDTPVLAGIAADDEIEAEFARLLGIKRDKATSDTRAATEDIRKGEAHESKIKSDEVGRARDQAAIRAADALAGGKPMEAATVGKLAGYDSKLAQLRDLAARKPGINTGPIASRANDIAQLFGIDDAEVTKFKADNANLVNQTISDLSGANVPPAEWERLRQGVPQPTDDDTAYMAKLQSTLANIEAARKYLVAAEGATGRNVAGVGGDPAAMTPEERRSRIQELLNKRGQ